MPAELTSLLHQPLVLIGLAVAVWYFWPQIQAALKGQSPSAPPAPQPVAATVVTPAPVLAQPVTMPVTTVQQITAPPVVQSNSQAQDDVSQLLTAVHALTVMRARLQQSAAPAEVIKQLDAMTQCLLTPIK